MLKEDPKLIPELLLEQERICLYGESIVKSKYFSTALRYFLSSRGDSTEAESVDACRELCQLLQQSLNDGDVQCLEDLRQVLILILESPSKPADLHRLIIVQYYIQVYPALPKAIQVQIEMRDRLQESGGNMGRDYDSYRRQVREGVKQLGLCFANSSKETREALKERYSTRVSRDAMPNALSKKKPRLSKKIPDFIPLDDVGNRVCAEYGWVAASVYLSAANTYCFYLNLEEQDDEDESGVDSFSYNTRVEAANELIRLLGKGLAMGEVECLSELKSVIEALDGPSSTTRYQRLSIIECFDDKFPSLPTVEEVIGFLGSHPTSKSKHPHRVGFSFS